MCTYINNLSAYVRMCVNFVNTFHTQACTYLADMRPCLCSCVCYVLYCVNINAEKCVKDGFHAASLTGTCSEGVVQNDNDVNPACK